MKTLKKIIKYPSGLFLALTNRPDLSFEQKRKRQLFVSISLPGMTILYAFAVLNLARSNYKLGSLDLLSAVAITAGLICFRYLKQDLQIYRGLSILLIGLFFYNTIIGGLGGSKILWSYFFPLFTFFLLGKKEGLLWSGILFFLSLFLLLAPQPVFEVYPYNPEFKLRFGLSFFLVLLMTYVYESVRQAFQKGMEEGHAMLLEEKEKLELAKKTAEASSEALKENEAKLRSIFRAAPTGIGVVSNRIIKQVNERLCKMLGYSSDELLGQNARMLYPSRREFDNVGQEKYGQIHRQGTGTIETRWQCKDGTIIDVLLSSTPLNPADLQEGVTFTALDITERKRAREELHKYERIVSASSDHMALLDHNYVYQTVNDAYLKSLNKRREDIVGRSVPELFGTTNFEKTTKPYIDRCLAGEVVRYQTWVNFPGIGRKFMDVVHYPYIEKDKSISGYVVNARDITEQNKLESQLQRAQKMEALGTLAGGVAHDLNNILSGLVSYPELILLDLEKESPLREPILTIKKSGEKAATIVQDLLTLARRGVASTEILNFNEIVADYLDSHECHQLLKYHPHVHIEDTLEDNILNINGSAVHLHKTVMNLVSNAAEAMHNPGKITLTTKNRYIDRPIRGYDDVAEGDYVVLKVSDSGIGISAEDIEKIFEPFYTKKVMGRSGTGLGMAVVWGTVKDHKGYIDIQSIEKEGTTFTLYFPVSRQKSTRKNTPLSLEDYSGKGETIMVVDDIPEQRKIASKMLEKLGYCVTSVSSGEDAIEHLKTNSADIIVLDMIMDPGIDGLETYRSIIELHPRQKAIIASGYAETNRVKEAQELGAGPYIKKPYILEKVGLAIRTELDNERPGRQPFGLTQK